MVESTTKRGLLLPEVATDHDLDLASFFEATLEKAGLGGRTFADVAVFTFTTETVVERL